MKKQNKGITLVALIVTIVVLLILAGISIASLTGNGLFEKAKLAKEKQENVQIEEDSTLEDYENKIGEYVVSSSREEKEVVIDGNEHIIGSYYGKNLYSKNFKGTTPNSSGVVAVNLSSLNIEEVIDYEGIIIKSTGTYKKAISYSGDTTDWAQFCIDSSKNLKYYCGSKEYYSRPYQITIKYTKTTD